MSKPFRKRNALALHELHYGPNMTPMVDVVMVILIFFMSSTAILGPEWFLRSSLPAVKESAAAPDEHPRRVQIHLRPSNDGTRLDVDNKRDLSFDSLAPLLQTLLKDRSPDSLVILIAPDAGTPYEDVVRVHEICERLRLKKVGLFDPASNSASPPIPSSENAK